MAAVADVDYDLVNLPAAYLRAIRTGEAVGRYERALRDIDPDVLAAVLDDDATRRAFWTNLYNAAVQRLLDEDPDLYDRKRKFFGAERITVAGHPLSLDDIEHGLLRRSLLKYGLGYIPNPVPGSFERRFRIRERDPRIHFALNCGAASCPPIDVYSAQNIDAEFEIATASYLESEVAYEPNRGVVRVPRIFLWFRGDFGGKDGIIELLRQHDHVPTDARPRLKHRSYDWSLDREQYR